MAGPAPSLIVFAGPNGSGKSSLTRGMIAAGYELGGYINPDDIAAELEGSYADRVRAAQAIADQRRAEAIAARRSFSFETVFSHPSKLTVLDEAKRAGFDVLLFFVGLDDPAINVERVGSRVLTGGHAVPADRIVARYHRTMAMLPDMLYRADRAWVFDNTVRAVSPDQFAGRLVADARRNRGRLRLKLNYPLPDWVERYLVKPMRGRAGILIVQ